VTNITSNINCFDTSTVDNVIYNVDKYNPDAIIVMKSTVFEAYAEEQRENHLKLKIIISLEFLSEGKALYDNLYSSRMVVGLHFKKQKLLSCFQVPI